MKHFEIFYFKESRKIKIGGRSDQKNRNVIHVKLDFEFCGKEERLGRGGTLVEYSRDEI